MQRYNQNNFITNMYNNLESSPLPNISSNISESEYTDTSPSTTNYYSTSSTDGNYYSNYNYGYQDYYNNYYNSSQNASPINYYYKPNPFGYASYSEQNCSNYMYSNWNSSDYNSSIPSTNLYNASYYNTSPSSVTSASSNSSPTSASNISNKYDNYTLNKCYENSINLVSDESTTSYDYELKDKPKTKSKHSAKTVSKKHQLPDEAVDILNEWFDEHVNNPYPQLEEKERLAKAGNITVKQVNAWFSNRRNRSQNTKPKRIKRDLENKINDIFHELITDDSNKTQIIEKFRQTLANNQ